MRKKRISSTVFIITILVAATLIITLGNSNPIISANSSNLKKETRDFKYKISNNFLLQQDISLNSDSSWDLVLVEANNNPQGFKYSGQSSNNIGIGTNKSAVNMDLWEFEVEEDGNFRLKKYTGSIIGGEIQGKVPQYIYDTVTSSFKPVTSLYNTFSSKQSLLMTPEIPSTVTSIYNGAFADCTSLNTVTIPNTVKNIYNGAFSGCSNLAYINLPEGIEGIYNSAFASCTKLEGIVIPNSVTNVEGMPFYGCTKLQNVTTKILSDGMFSTCPAIKNVTLLDGITNINDGAFYNCTALERITIPSSVTNIGAVAFGGCTNLTNITVNKNAGSISGFPWGAISATVTWNTEMSWDTLLTEANANPQNFKYVGQTSSVIGIGIDKMPVNMDLWGSTLLNNGSFKLTNYTGSITSGNIEGKIPQYIYDTTTSSFKPVTVLYETFKNKTSLAQMPNIPDTVSDIGYYSFSNTGLTDVTIAGNVSKIGEGAFLGSSVTNVRIQSGVTLIDNGAFYNCTSLNSITLPETLTTIGESVFYKSSLGNVSIPNTVTTIGAAAFNECTRLESITLSNSLQTINSFTFNKCTNLQRIVIPESVTSIGNDVFNDCTSLLNINIKKQVGSLAGSPWGAPLATVTWNYTGI